MPLIRNKIPGHIFPFHLISPYENYFTYILNILSQDTHWNVTKSFFFFIFFSVLMAIIANDFTLGYFNFSFGLPTAIISPEILQAETSLNPTISIIDNEFINDITTDDNEWVTADTKTTWD